MKNEKNSGEIQNPHSQLNSLFDYVRSELRRGYLLQNDEQRYREKTEKLYVSLQIPYQLEKVCCILFLSYESFYDFPVFIAFSLF